MPLEAVPDHISIAVPDPERTAARWADQLGGGLLTTFQNPMFHGRQYRYANGAKLEVIGPPPGGDASDSFLRRFLDRFGSRIHHVTLKVPDIHDALDTVREAGLDPVDVQTDSDRWREGFLRPSQVGGLVVQLAWASHTDDEWAAYRGHVPQPPAGDAAALLGARMRHPDLDRAAELWTLLGAEAERGDGTLTVAWAGSPLELVIERGDEAGPVALRFAGAEPQDADPVLGPPVEVEPGS